MRAIRDLVTADEVTSERVLSAARVKARHDMALADAFAIATSHAYGAVLLTGDPEVLAADGPWKVEDLRAPAAPA